MLTRVPILVRLTAAFSVAMVVVLTGAGVFVALRLRIDLDDRVDENLASRLVAAERAARAAGDVSAVPVDEILQGELRPAARRLRRRGEPVRWSAGTGAGR